MTTTKRRGAILTTDAEIDRACQDAAEREKAVTKIRGVSYDPEADAVTVDLSTGASLTVPRRAIPGFARARPEQLSDIVVETVAESLWSDAVDDGVLLEQLIEIAFGETTLKTLGGRISGRVTSAAKAAASRTNGRKGGRPRGGS